MAPPNELTGHVVVCGMGHVGFRTVQLLAALKEKVVVVTEKARDERVRAARQAGAIVLFGDARDQDLLAEEAGLAKAKAIIAATSSDTTNVEIALDSKRLAPHVAVVARIFDQHLARSFEKAFGVKRAVASSSLAAPTFAAAALNEQIVGSLMIDDQTLIVGRVDIGAASEMLGRDRAELAKRGLLVLDGPISGTIAAGDRHLVIASEPAWALAAQRKTRRIKAPAPRSLVRLFRSWGAVWAGAPPLLRRSFATLLVLIALSVLVFQSFMDLGFVDAVYFIVSTVTTVGYGDISPLKSPPLLKLYACCVMLFGSAMIAVVYSLVTDFVVTERFRSLLQRPPVPDGGHVIAVGIGNLGYRILGELQRMGVPVVAVDLAPDGRLISEVGDGVPVVAGDARLGGTLGKAAVERATAVIAATGDDAVNLSVILAARELNPKARTVVRLFDPEFAEKVRVGLGVDAAFSASMISSPSLVGAALFPGAHTAFVVGEELFCLCTRAAQPDWIGMSPPELSDQARVIMRRVGPAFAPFEKDARIEAADELLVLERRPLQER
jgi:Trk K+ transport system NAD-binding subunit